MTADTTLECWLETKAGVSAKFIAQVIAACDEEMIGDVDGLRIARDAGLLSGMFKPVVKLGIEAALGADGTPFITTGGSSSPTVSVPLDLLEVSPSDYDMSKPPLNTYKRKNPHTGTIMSVKRIVGVNAPGEVCHVKINSGPTFKYWEGQSLGVTPPGVDAKSGKPNSVRLYSIASTRYGDDLDGNTVSLCVRRAVYWDKDLNAEDPAKKGICSNYLCDSTPGTEVTITGPTGKTMLMPEDKPEADLIMVATGTGIAPYRGFLRRLFIEETPAMANYRGLAWLVLGVPTSDGLLYDADWQEIAARKPDNFRVTYAISREQKSAEGGKMYVQDRLREHGEELFDRLQAGAHIYFCGLKGMMPPISQTLKEIAESKGLDWDKELERLKHAGQWHVEVY